MEMQGKQVAITGPTAGIGRSAALELARRGAELTLFCRNPDKARALQDEVASTGGARPVVILLDMARLDSVREAAAQFLDLGRPLDILLNNAGIVNATRRETVDGFEETLAVNHFAPFLLTGLLLPALQAAGTARIVNVASDAYTFVRDMGFDDMQALNNYSIFHEYGRSKLGNILYTRELARRLQGQGITVNCLHPGAVATSLATQNKTLASKLLPALLKPFFRSPAKGARTSIYLCSSADVANRTGEYFVDCKLVTPKPWARDDAAAARLWSYTEDCVKFSYPC